MQEKGTSLPRNNRTIIRGVIVALSLSALATSLIFYYTNADINQAFSSVNFWYLAAAVALIFLNYALEAEKLCAITDAVGRELSFRKALQIALVGSFFANITPFDTGGEPFQIYLLARNGIATGKSVAVIMVKGIISAIARLALGIVIPVWLILMKKAWSLPPALNTFLNVGIFLYLIATFLMVLFTLRPQLFSRFVRWLFTRHLLERFWKREKLNMVADRIVHEVQEFRDSIREVARTKRKNLILVGFYSMLLWIITLTVPALLLWGLGVNSPLSQILAVGIIFYLASAYAPTPGSSGVAEAGFATIFFMANLVPYPLLGVFVILWRFLTYYMSLLIGGIVSFFAFFHRKR
ncbi:MAG: lysylphosphatidylglycerol synthase transmembrane domain-containing protein [Coprothermobacterota bacterium]|nr:lysylphosphatidylglycerol synthase transmembrane domain-containing protein [Coprothermobacterota bacterium]